MQTGSRTYGGRVAESCPCSKTLESPAKMAVLAQNGTWQGREEHSTSWSNPGLLYIGQYIFFEKEKT